jgi:transcriptional regulator with XRE-family HTH domain
MGVHNGCMQDDPSSVVASLTVGKRRRLGLTQRELARRARVTDRYIANLESGGVSQSVLTFLRVAHVLGIENLERIESPSG